MIDTRKLSSKEREEIIKKRLADYAELSGFYDIDTMHTTLHVAKTDYPDKKFFTNFNGMFFLSDDEDLTADFMYRTITGESRSEHKNKQIRSMGEHRKRDVERDIFTTRRISDLVKAGLKVLAEELWDDWIDIVPRSVFDMYNGNDLEWFIELHLSLSTETFDYCKMIFEGQGHSGMSASRVFMLLERFSPNGKEFVKYLNKRN